MNKKGFTLIELLIVVAIIAILAAIAVPNFLEAQTRSKVSRCRADMRSLVTAIESYYVDNNKYPPAQDRFLVVNGTNLHVRTPSYLTTPIGYITSLPFDPFVDKKNTYSGGPYTDKDQIGKRYAYYECAYLETAYPIPWGANKLSQWVGPWLMYGYGPDKNPFQGAGATLLPYDPTNGTVSPGNIVRCQKNNESTPINPLTGNFNFQ
ncbi:prepilin-type N-terminal cleavage/methylation domain-containing protein [Candidatus Sumerlaeota bacterium]|nr:prepilin-type N-terminal cleavage/methylation domain-containing protein [Candidatus Sumerlaeota bacterium]